MLTDLKITLAGIGCMFWLIVMFFAKAIWLKIKERKERKKKI